MVEAARSQSEASRPLSNQAEETASSFPCKRHCFGWAHVKCEPAALTNKAVNEFQVRLWSTPIEEGLPVGGGHSHVSSNSSARSSLKHSSSSRTCATSSGASATSGSGAALSADHMAAKRLTRSSSVTS